VIDVVLGNLPEGRTRVNERYAYVGVTDWDWDGKLVIEAGLRKKTVDEYHVVEVEPEGFPGRVFLLAKQVRGTEVYQCSVGGGPDPLASEWACTCKAGQVRKYRCKHFLALSDYLRRKDSR
jgi:hypothetical protein